mmetsp:Transcript_26130/g.53509  ORF Transcript_26130/g.53509 Transcript_26130/m.53509 type:complete len:211 (+) Transcript_26130:938-1570(+)
MASDVHDQSATGLRRTYPPGEFFGIHAPHKTTTPQLVRNGGNTIPTCTIRQQCPDRLSPLVSPANIRCEQRQSLTLEGVDYSSGLESASTHRLLDIARLTGLRDSASDFEVRSGRRGDVHGLQVRIGEEGVEVVVRVHFRPAPLRARAFRDGGGHAPHPLLRGSRSAPHDRDEVGSVALPERRSRFDRGDVAEADDAPSDLLSPGEWLGA